MLGDDGLYIYVYSPVTVKEREREWIVGREGIDFFLSPSDESAAGGVVRGTETDNVKAHTANRPVTPRSYVT